MNNLNRLMAVLLLVLPISIFAQPFVQFTAESTNVNCETNSLSIDIDVKDYIDVNAWQFSFHWDPTVLSYVPTIPENAIITGLVPNIGISFTGTSQGIISFSWSTSSTGTTVADGTIITLNFDLIGNASQFSELTFEEPPLFTVIGQYGNQLLPTEYQLNTGLVDIIDNVNPTINCSNNLTFDTNGANNMTITAAGPTNTSDNCGVDFVSYDLTGATTGSGIGDVSNNVSFNVGTTTVEYTVHDFEGNTMACSFEVEITNNIAPSPTLALHIDDLTINCETNTASINVTADNFIDMIGSQFNLQWDPMLLEYIDISNVVFPPGTATFGLTQLSSGVLTVIWGDNNPLTLGLGTTLFTINFNIIEDTNLIPITFFDNPMVLTQFISTSSLPSTIPPTGYELNNGSITITDNTNPSVNCPANVTINSTNGANAVVTMIPPTASDNCAIADTSFSVLDINGSVINTGSGDASGTVFPIGINTVEYTITDFAGNTSSCNFQVEITNDMPGVLTLYLDELVINCEDKTASINVYADDFNDIVGTQINLKWNPSLVEYIDTSNIILPPGGIAWGLSNISNGEISFIWGDINNPQTLADGTVLFTLNFSINSPSGFTIPIQFFENTAVPTKFLTSSSFPLSIPVSEYELIDGSIFIFDNEPPTVSCPSDVTVTSSNGTDAVVNTIPLITDDNCGILDTTYTLTDDNGGNIGSGSGDVSGTTFPLGTTTVTYTVTDFDGNMATCDFDVTVTLPLEYIMDIDSVDVNCTNDTALVGFTLDNYSNVIGFQFTIEWDETQLKYESVSDNVTPPGVPGISSVNNGVFTYAWSGPPTNFPVGFQFIELEFSILNNTVGNDVDIEFITMGAPTPLIVVTQEPGSSPTVISGGQATFNNGNVEIVDNSTPSLSCPNDVSINANGLSSIPVPDIGAISSDDCGIPLVTYEIATTPPITGTGDASGNIFPEGITTVTYTSTDDGGNSVSCSFTVSVIQDPLMISCPSNINQDSDSGFCSADIGSLPVNILSDPMNVSTISYEMTGASGLGMGTGDIPAMTYNVGTTNLIYTVTDIFGAVETCTLTVVINDTEAPIFSNVPQNVTVECDAIPTTVNPTAIDNCDGNVNVIYNGETILPGGEIIRSWTTTDSEGNTETVSQTITVVDTQAPIFSNVPQNVTVECDAIPATVNPTATDNCDGNVTVFYNGETILPGGGTIIRVWTTTDAAGNSTNTSQTITVVDTTPPSLICPSDITVDAISSMLTVCGNNVTWTAVTATDNCDTDVQTTSTHNSGDFFEIGTTTVTTFAVDDDGNIDSCKFNVTVLDTEPPTLTNCPTNIIISGGINCATSVVWNPPTVTDNCDDNIIITCNIMSGSNFSVGTTPVTCTATDASGNTSSCNFTVTVFDDIAPEIACPADITVSTNGSLTDPNNFILTTTPVGCDSVILTFGLPIAADNCGLPSIVQTEGLLSGSIYGIGTHIIEFVATDGAGNTDTCETNITITPFADITAIATPDTVCIGESTILSVGAPGTIEWTSPDGTISNNSSVTIDNATLADSGTYIVIVTDPNTMCSSQTTVELVVLEGPDISIVANSLNCTDGDIDIPLSGINNGTLDVNAWEWTNPDGMVFSTMQNAVISQAKESDSGIYCLKATSSNGCSTTLCEEITITDNPLAAPTINSNCGGFLCVGETCTLAGFFTEPDIDSVIWTTTDLTGGAGLPSNVNTNQISITPTLNGIYTYTYTIFSDGCSSSTNVPLQVSSPASVEPDSFQVEFNGTSLLPVTDNDIVPGSLPGTFTINVTSEVSNGTLVNNGDGTFNYTPDESFFGTDQFIYEICLDCNNQTVCRWAVVTLEVTTEECLIPTVITPNDDGMNDALEITCVDQNPDNELVVYNRWGDEVYRASPYNNDWKGTYNDQQLPDGTYFFVFLRNANDSDPQKGSLTIMR